MIDIYFFLHVKISICWIRYGLFWLFIYAPYVGIILSFHILLTPCNSWQIQNMSNIGINKLIVWRVFLFVVVWVLLLLFNILKDFWIRCICLSFYLVHSDCQAEDFHSTSLHIEDNLLIRNFWCLWFSCSRKAESVTHNSLRWFTFNILDTY